MLRLQPKTIIDLFKIEKKKKKKKLCDVMREELPMFIILMQYLVPVVHLDGLIIDELAPRTP